MIQQQVQQKASRISSEHKLGALQREYNTQCKSRPLPAATIQLISLLFSCWLISIPVSSRFFPSKQAFPVFPESLVGIFFFLGMFCLFVSILFCWSYWSNYPFRHSQEFLYEHGFLLIACRDEHFIGSEAIHWREVGTVCYTLSYNSDADSREENYTLQYHNNDTFGNHVCEQKGKQRQPHRSPYSVKNSSHGASLSFCEYRFSPRLGQEIESRVLPYLVSRAFATYQQGLPVRFGLLTLHLGGIEYQDKLLPWHEVLGDITTGTAL